MRILLLLSLLLTSVFAWSQQVNGIVHNNEGNPLAPATVNLLRAKDSASVKLAITKTDGSFSFISVPPGEYRILVSFVGYKASYTTMFSFKGNDITVPGIKLEKLPTSLAGVTVNATKPIIEVKADKMILNVEGTINAIGSNALELLRRSPSVLLDKDDNISMAGKNGLQVYIDGRPSPLSGQDLAHYLRSIPSAQIEAIELITNPSAKYDAAGNAGIINIKLVRNKSLGTNGSVNAGWNIGTYAKYNAGVTLNYRDQKLNMSGSYNYVNNLNETQLTVTRNVADTTFNQRGLLLDKRIAHSFKFGADYVVNKKNTLGVMVNGVIADPVSDSRSNTVISATRTGIMDRQLVATNHTGLKRNNTNINFNYAYNDPKGTTFTLNADRGHYDFNSDQLQSNFYFSPAGAALPGTAIYHMFSPAQINIHSLKADYEQPFAKGKLSIGAKSAWVKTDNDFRRFNVQGSSEDLDRDRSNHFIYSENIRAGYINYNRQYKKLMIQAGLRIENTNSTGKSDGMKWNGSHYVSSTSAFKRNYTNLFPSAAITFNKNPMKQWSLTYSRRIDRPVYQDLNPFEFKLDEYTSMKGNINLRPQYTNSFGISHTYKYKLNISLNYSHVKDMFTQIIDTADKTKAFMSKKNLATQDIIAFNISYPYVYKNYTLFTNLSGNYSKYRADFGTGRKIDLDAMGLSLFMQHSLKFKKNWTAELSSFFNAPTVYQGNFKGKAMGSVDAGLSKQILKGRATIKTSVSDIFRTQRFNALSDFAGQQMRFIVLSETRQFKLSMNWRFGNTNMKPSKQKSVGTEEELKRVQQGNGGFGN